ncbi:MAG: Coenzyme F420 hydrogenase/dehydrogenase, beta subunit C-terminal domain [Bacillota bacterium]
MLKFIDDKSKCTGCGACVSICPTNCISFAHDEEGFAYPEADLRCIDCCKCYDVCPMAQGNLYDMSSSEQFCVAARHLDHAVWEKSSSGGAFAAICSTYCDIGDVIFGARFDDLRVVHDYVCSPYEIEPFMRSKYVQSDLGDSYYEARHMLENGRKVLFSGTPCQVAGLRNFLGQDHKNLLSVDLICHGVGSPGVFRRYIQELGIEFGSKVTSFSFRNQRLKMGHFIDHIIEVEFESGMTIEDGLDLYNTGFIQCLFLRPSCGACKFATLDRVGDITIGDFKKRYDVLPQARGLENLSTIIVNSNKGKEVFDLLGQHMHIYPVSIEDIASTNNPLRTVSRMSESRGKFFDDLAVGMPIRKALEKHIVTMAPGGFVRKVWLLLPDALRARIRRWLS